MRKKPIKRINKQYYFSVEGETEKLYLKHLQNLINTEVENKNPTEHSKVNFDIKKGYPDEYVKGLSILSGTDIYHICDLEGRSLNDINAFKSIIDKIKKAEKQKSVKYTLCYSNLTFEVWLIMHKKYFSKPCNKNTYLNDINSAFQTNFDSVKTYKKQKNLEGCITTITLEDVRMAVENARSLEDEIKKSNPTIENHNNFKYICNNPYTSIFHIIEKILKDCGLYKNSGQGN